MLPNSTGFFFFCKIQILISPVGSDMLKWQQRAPTRSLELNITHTPTRRFEKSCPQISVAVLVTGTGTPKTLVTLDWVGPQTGGGLGLYLQFYASLEKSCQPQQYGWPGTQERDVTELRLAQLPSRWETLNVVD